MIQALAAYLFAAMTAWTGLNACADQPDHCATWSRIHYEPADAARVRYQGIADDVAAEADRREGEPVLRMRRSVDLVAIAYEETGLHRLVDDGTCNTVGLGAGLAKRVEAIGGCDSGRSYTVWQLQPGSYVNALERRRITGQELLEDRALAVHVAWDFREVRPSAWTVWPRAAHRSERWIADHPLPTAPLTAVAAAP